MTKPADRWGGVEWGEDAQSAAVGQRTVELPCWVRANSSRFQPPGAAGELPRPTVKTTALLCCLSGVSEAIFCCLLTWRVPFPRLAIADRAAFQPGSSSSSEVAGKYIGQRPQQFGCPHATSRVSACTCGHLGSSSPCLDHKTAFSFPRLHPIFQRGRNGAPPAPRPSRRSPTPSFGVEAALLRWDPAPLPSRQLLPPVPPHFPHFPPAPPSPSTPTSPPALSLSRAGKAPGSLAGSSAGASAGEDGPREAPARRPEDALPRPAAPVPRAQPRRRRRRIALTVAGRAGAEGVRASGGRT